MLLEGIYYRREYLAVQDVLLNTCFTGGHILRDLSYRRTLLI